MTPAHDPSVLALSDNPTDPGCGKHAAAMRLFRRRAARLAESPVRLHVGSGTEAIAGWINIDNHALPGVDRVLDVRRGLPFRDVVSIYAEHFLEHLSLDDGLAFLVECRQRPDRARGSCGSQRPTSTGSTPRTTIPDSGQPTRTRCGIACT